MSPTILITWALLAPTAEARPAPLQAKPDPIAADAPKAPFRRRQRTGVSGLHSKQAGLIDLSRWPEEPAITGDINADRFAAALEEACSVSAKARIADYTKWILTHSARFGVDPFLVAAVIYRQSRCRSKAESDYGVGLSRIHVRMHAPHISEGVYAYHVLEGGEWQARALPIPDFGFSARVLRQPEASIYFTAALLAVHKAQCPKNDGVFGSVPHRHFVSHFAWGDWVRGAGAEDRALRARRRILRLYRGEPAAPTASFEGLPVLCPLDGFPRKLTSAWGADRAGGRRKHKGIDFSSDRGEPVRAIAAGRVVIAGLDRRKGGSAYLTPEVARTVPARKMGPGGLFVMLEHEGGLRSAYMHLSSYRVRSGQQVEAGERIGRVGRTGIRDSGAHLHFELRKDGRHVDPLPVMAPYVFEPWATWRGRVAEAEAKRRARRRRRRARAARRKTGPKM